MKRFLLALILPLCGSAAHLAAQDSLTASPDLQTTAEQYLEARLQRDWPRLMDLIYPAVFQHITSEELTATLENGEGNGLAPAPRQLSVAHITTPQTIGEERFALVETLALSELHLDGPQFQDERLVTLLRRNFERQYGADNVEYLPEESLIRIHTSAYLMAIAHGESDDWRFLEKAPEFQQLWIKCVPPEAGSLNRDPSN